MPQKINENDAHVTVTARYMRYIMQKSSIKKVGKSVFLKLFCNRYVTVSLFLYIYISIFYILSRLYIDIDCNRYVTVTG